MNWNAPWLWEGYVFDEEAFRKEKEAQLQAQAALDAAALRDYFVICHEGVLIGSCSSYLIDEQGQSDPLGMLRAVGIMLPSVRQRGKGIGTIALRMLCDYYFDHGETALYTQTWSGNTSMLALAAKLGFTPFLRRENVRLVKGMRYDALTLRKEKDDRAISEGGS